MKIIKTIEDKFGDLYIKAIKRECDKKGISVEVVKPETEEDFLIALSENEWKLVLEPCKYDIPNNFPMNLEQKNTAKAILEYSNEFQSLVGRNMSVLVVNRSELIGKPLATMLLENDFTVTIAHSKTGKMDLKAMTRIADIIVLATGHDMSHLDLSGKFVIDASGDYKKSSDKCLTYIGMRLVGDLTTEIMLNQIK